MDNEEACLAAKTNDQANGAQHMKCASCGKTDHALDQCTQDPFKNLNNMLRDAARSVCQQF